MSLSDFDGRVTTIRGKLFALEWEIPEGAGGSVPWALRRHEPEGDDPYFALSRREENGGGVQEWKYLSFSPEELRQLYIAIMEVLGA